MNNPLVSIIIPTYNRAHLIGETLDSVFAQTYENWECIVVDDGSIDETAILLAEYCAKHTRFQYLHRPKERPKGANACRNYGFELSNGEYINWFDDDDLMHRDKLLIQIKALTNSNYNFSVCQTLVFTKSLENIIGLRSESIYSNNIFEDYLKQKVILMTPSAIWKKSFLNSFEYLFDEELQAAQEWEFYCRILYICSNYDVIDKELVFIRQHEGSISSNSNMRIKLLNYFVARNKVYSNKTILLSESTSIYLEGMMLFYFKSMIRNDFMKEAFLAFKLFILNNKNMSLKAKFASLTSILSFTLFKKGEVFLKKVLFKSIH
jgi:glycosyltransferase involved in cell wall biosynthesis